MGKIIGIAKREISRGPMEVLEQAQITLSAGIEGDSKGKRFPLRQLTILAIEDWQATLALLGGPKLDWTVRRANLLVQDIKLPRGNGSRLECGDVVLEVTGQTSPCQQMENPHAGLRRALAGDWRGGITCRVLSGGFIKHRDSIDTILHNPESVIRLP